MRQGHSGKAGGPDPSKGGRKTQRVRRATAFQAFLEILETADWIRHELRGQMEMFDITLEGLRFLELLQRHGHLTIREAAERRHCSKQSAANMVEGLRERGWVEYEVESLPRKTEPREPGHGRLGGWRLGHIRLSGEGQEFIGAVLPRNIKVVLAFMRALEWREQQTLIRTCRKLRDRNLLRFMEELERPVEEG